MFLAEQTSNDRHNQLGVSRIRKSRSKAGKIVGFGFSEARVRVPLAGSVGQ
jgi:hypothetical protein